MNTIRNICETPYFSWGCDQLKKTSPYLPIAEYAALSLTIGLVTYIFFRNYVFKPQYSYLGDTKIKMTTIENFNFYVLSESPTTDQVIDNLCTVYMVSKCSEISKKANENYNKTFGPKLHLDDNWLSIHGKLCSNYHKQLKGKITERLKKEQYTDQAIKDLAQLIWTFQITEDSTPRTEVNASTLKKLPTSFKPSKKPQDNTATMAVYQVCDEIFKQFAAPEPENR